MVSLVLKFSGTFVAFSLCVFGSPFIILGCVWTLQVIVYQLTMATFPPDLLASGIIALVIGGFFEVLAVKVAKTVGESV